MDNIPARWGPGFVGFIISVALYGVSIAQTIFYYRVFRDDSNSTKILVAVIMFLDTLHTYCLAQLLWIIFIKGRHNHALLSMAHWETPVSVLITSIIICVVQCFYGARVWRISQNRIVVGLIITLSIVQIAAGGVYIAHAFDLKSSRLNYAGQYAEPVQMGMTVACDFLITISMIYYLHIMRTGEPSSEALIHKITVYTVNLGSLGCVVALLLVIMIELPTPFYPGLGLAPGMIISQCYSNSLLAILNARRTFRVICNNPNETFVLPTIHPTQDLEST